MNNPYLFSEPPRVSDADFEKIHTKMTGEGRTPLSIVIKLLSFLLLVVITAPFIGFLLFMLVEMLPFVKDDYKPFLVIIPALLIGFFSALWFVYLRTPDSKTLKRIWQYGKETTGKITKANSSTAHFTYRDEAGNRYTSRIYNPSIDLQIHIKEGDGVKVYYLPENSKKCSADYMNLANNMSQDAYYGNNPMPLTTHIAQYSPAIIQKRYMAKVQRVKPLQFVMVVIGSFILALSFHAQNPSLGKEWILYIAAAVSILIYIIIRGVEIYNRRRIINIVINGIKTTGTISKSIISKEFSVATQEFIAWLLFPRVQNIAVNYRFPLENKSYYTAVATLRMAVKDKDFEKGTRIPVFYLRDKPSESFPDIYGLTQNSD